MEAQTDPNKRLAAAVQKNDLKAVREALDHGAAPDTPMDDTSVDPVSCLAAHRGQAAILKALLDHGANPHILTKTDNTSLLMFAVHHASLDAVRLLLKRKVSVNLRNKLGETALNTVGETEPPLPSRRVAVMRLLLKAGADPEIRDREGRTALMRYADYGIVKGVEVLADAGNGLEGCQRGGVDVGYGILPERKVIYGKERVANPYSACP